jgi:predicted Rossmann-fold nucleotide-binding protein
MDEMFEVLTWSQLGLHRKPCALLDVDGYYAPLVTFLDHAAREGLLKPEHRAMLLVEHDPEVLLERMAGHVAPPVPQVLTPERT